MQDLLWLRMAVVSIVVVSIIVVETMVVGQAAMEVEEVMAVEVVEQLYWRISNILTNFTKCHRYLDFVC
jgi:hypothetical protein